MKSLVKSTDFPCGESRPRPCSFGCSRVRSTMLRRCRPGRDFLMEKRGKPPRNTWGRWNNEKYDQIMNRTRNMWPFPRINRWHVMTQPTRGMVNRLVHAWIRACWGHVAFGLAPLCQGQPGGGAGGFFFVCSWNCREWPWLVYPFGYGSIPINTIFRGMNIHLPAILMWTTGVQGFDTLPFIHNNKGCLP